MESWAREVSNCGSVGGSGENFGNMFMSHVWHDCVFLNNVQWCISLNLCPHPSPNTHIYHIIHIYLHIQVERDHLAKQIY